MTERVALVLKLDRTTDRISGTLGHGDAPPRAFDGWLELSALLEQIRQPPTHPPDAVTRPHR
jgi:hypothetical protein